VLENVEETKSHVMWTEWHFFHSYRWQTGKLTSRNSMKSLEIVVRIGCHLQKVSIPSHQKGVKKWSKNIIVSEIWSKLTKMMKKHKNFTLFWFFSWHIKFRIIQFFQLRNDGSLVTLLTLTIFSTFKIDKKWQKCVITKSQLCQISQIIKKRGQERYSTAKMAYFSRKLKNDKFDAFFVTFFYLFFKGLKLSKKWLFQNW
jgi:hypothetical protein